MSQLGHAIDPDAIVCTINVISDSAGAGAHHELGNDRQPPIRAMEFTT
jgi:hypothetical protein